MSPVAHYYWLGEPNKTIPKELVIHCKYWNYLPLSNGGLYGLSPLKAGSRLVTRSNNVLTASVKNLENMGAVGILSRRVGSTEKPLTVEQARMIEQKYYENYGGPEKSGKSPDIQWQISITIGGQKVNRT